MRGKPVSLLPPSLLQQHPSLFSSLFSSLFRRASRPSSRHVHNATFCSFIQALNNLTVRLPSRLNTDHEGVYHRPRYTITQRAEKMCYLSPFPFHQAARPFHSATLFILSDSFCEQVRKRGTKGGRSGRRVFSTVVHHQAIVWKELGIRFQCSRWLKGNL